MRLLRSLAKDAFPLFCLVLFQAAIGASVACMDAGAPESRSNALYAVFVQCTAAVVYLVVRSALRAREWRDLARASRDPLNAEPPMTRGESGRAWRTFASGQRREAARLLSERDAASTAELEAFVASIHAMKAPVATLGLLADRSELSGEPLNPRDLKMEVEELDRLLELSLGRIRLADFDRDSRIETVELRDLATQSVRRCRRLFIARGISLTLSDIPVDAETDRKWMGFILDQLVVNAAKYASSSVRVDIRRSDEGAVISIRDDGPGIPADERGRLFTRSFVGSTGRSSDATGIPSSGYGLFLSLRVAEKLGVLIDLKDLGDGGTAASVSIPAERPRFE